MSNFELLAHAAQCKGSAGVHEYLQEHRLVAPDFLQELSTPILLGVEDKDEDATAADFGICMEKLNLRVQRDIWSALASGASPCADTAVSLARAFLRVTAIPRRREIDNVCLLLAKMVLQEDADDQKRESNPVDNAFRRRMRRSTMNRVEFSLQNENHGKLVTSSRLYTTRLAASRSKKRVRADVVLDQILVQKTEQRLRDQSLSCIPTPEPPLISKKMEDRASNLAKRLDHLSYSESTTVADDIASCVFTLLAEIVNDVRTTYVANERSFQYLCTVLRIDSANDEVLYQITRALVDSNWSSRYAAIFIKTSVLPKLLLARYYFLCWSEATMII
ncbi:uncharacterized protein PHALS_02289 [Plasmopara halstedii]|uniref:Uncharacterized protein n=1 Tax=Plasmopara halstedii TaxID=4781 RepID=A0A0P1AW56_PLAHL|nr:uncharacterized protein PHALS_02289 [Plasmopara halstedii]CEG45957.1 hypothetical protein PHALS_02289 [Plasmopara halstedii]|eukprot:XP_024582326.1 hypothetical protein PHALS_02289 [Plasmopara halstedii]